LRARRPRGDRDVRRHGFRHVRGRHRHQLTAVSRNVRERHGPGSGDRLSDHRGARWAHPREEPQGGRHGGGRAAAAPDGGAGGAGGATMDRVLVIDDEKGMRDFLAIMLKKEGYAVVVSESADKASELIGKGEFDLVISDIAMPGKSG